MGHPRSGALPRLVLALILGVAVVRDGHDPTATDFAATGIAAALASAESARDARSPLGELHAVLGLPWSLQAPLAAESLPDSASFVTGALLPLSARTSRGPPTGRASI